MTATASSWQAPQLVVRTSDPAYEAAYLREADALAPFRLTLAGAWAAMPNLLAEMLHPASHWSLQLDNTVPPPAAAAAAQHGGAAATPADGKLNRSSTADMLEPAASAEDEQPLSRTDSSCSI